MRQGRKFPPNGQPNTEQPWHRDYSGGPAVRSAVSALGREAERPGPTGLRLERWKNALAPILHTTHRHAAARRPVPRTRQVRALVPKHQSQARREAPWITLLGRVVTDACRR